MSYEFTPEAQELLDGATVSIQAEQFEDTTAFTVVDSNGVVEVTFELLNAVERDLSLSQYSTVVISQAHVALLEHLRAASESVPESEQPTE